MKIRQLLILFFLLILRSVPAFAGFIEDAQFNPGERIGIFIGTFDPFHNSHAARVDAALNSGTVDRVVVLPNSLSWHKSNVSPYADRVHLLHVAFEKSDRVFVPKSLKSPILPTGPVFLRKLRKQCPKCEFVGMQGSDVAAKSVHRWMNHIFLPGVNQWLLFNRDGSVTPELLARLGKSSTHQVIQTTDREVSSTAIRKWFALHPEFFLGLAEAPPPDLSPEVAREIMRNGYYRPNIDRRTHPVFSVLSFDPAKFKWKSGQILAVSGRAGLSPVVVQSTTESPVDHVAIVSVESDGAVMVYEFTNGKGIAKSPLLEVLDRARGRSGHLMSAVAEVLPELERGDWEIIKKQADIWVENQKNFNPGKMPNAPKSCSQFVHAAFETAGYDVGHIVTPEQTNIHVFNGVLSQNWKEILIDNENLIPPVSIIGDDDLKIIESNMPRDFHWERQQMVQAWKDDGSLEKVVRFIAIKEGTPIRTPIELEQGIEKFIQEFEVANSKEKRSICERVLKFGR